MADTISGIAVSGEDYADPALWEAASNVSAGRWIGEIRDNSEYLNTNLNFSGGTGTPDADNFDWLRVASPNKHSGVAGSGHARLRDTGGHVITISKQFVVIEGLDIIQDSSSNSDEGIRVASGAEDALISRNIIRATAATSDQDGIYTGNWAAILHLDNNIVYGFGRGGIHIQNFTGFSTQTINIESCAVYDCGTDGGVTDGGIVSRRGSSSTNNINVYNTWSMENTASSAADFVDGSSPPTWAGSGNIASDASAEAKFMTSFDSVVLIDTDPASGENVHVTSISGRDFNLVDEDTETVTQNGVNRSGSETAPQTTNGTILVQDLSTDINDVTRTATWSIGPFEFVLGGGPTGRIMRSLVGIGGGLVGKNGGLVG